MPMVGECGGDKATTPRHFVEMTEIPIILLAAGQSSRMRGVDKLLRQAGADPLLRRSAKIALTAGSVIVALPPAPHPRYSALEGLPVRSVAVPGAVEGINASLRTALAHVPDDAKAVMVLLADQPDLTSSDLKALMVAVSKHPEFVIWRGATEDGKPGHPVIFDRSMFDALSKLSGDTGARELVQSVADKVYQMRLPGQNARLDLDTPEDWNSWLERKSAKQ